MQKHEQEIRTDEKQVSQEIRTARADYSPPTFTEVGTVQALTHGSREQTSDEPGSGYKGG